jgi:hypothetical protein
MNKNTLRVEMGIPLLAHPKNTYSTIGGLTDSDSEYNPEDELDDLIKYCKEVESNSTKNTKSDKDSLPNLFIYATQGWTMNLVETGPQSLKSPSSQPAYLPFQEGTPIDPSGSKQDQVLKDLCREILMVRISEHLESDDNSIECLSLDDYNSDDYNEYLSNNVKTTPPAVTEVKITIKQDPPAAPLAVTMTVQLEEEPVAEDLYEHRRLLNQKRAFRR